MPNLDSSDVEVAALLHWFTEAQVAGLLLNDWESLLAIAGPDGRLEAMRVEARDAFDRYREGEDDGGNVSILLDRLIEIRKLVLKARRLLDGPEDEWGSATPLALSRTVARRCGDPLACCPPDTASPLLKTLPGGPHA